MSAPSVPGKFNQLVYNYPIRIPERFSLVIRSLLTQEGICFTLKPNFKFLEVRLYFTYLLVLLQVHVLVNSYGIFLVGKRMKNSTSMTCYLSNELFAVCTM